MLLRERLLPPRRRWKVHGAGAVRVELMRKTTRNSVACIVRLVRCADEYMVTTPACSIIQTEQIRMTPVLREAAKGRQERSESLHAVTPGTRSAIAEKQ
uniref:Uncharacterized protein n=1 Tax=Rhipicephalus zambeziensis TaxID=60191 RepID=A0A224Y6H6_9ACAR